MRCNMAMKQRRIHEPSSGERTFITYYKMFGDSSLPYEREYIFHPTRNWRLDFAWPVQKVAVEIEGGVFSGGRHTRGTGFTEDCEKYNAATLHGWRLLRFTPQMLEADPETCIEQVLQLLEQRKPSLRIIQTSSLGGTNLCTCATFSGNEIRCKVCGGFMF
jgi:hypothetical protein